MSAEQNITVRYALASMLLAVEDHNHGKAQDWQGLCDSIYGLIEAFPNELGAFQPQADRVCGNYLATV